MSKETTKNSRKGVGGVKTPEGKAVSRYNAQKHMVLRETATKYEEVDLEEIYNDLARDLNPKGRAQETLIEIIAINMIKLTRLVKSEAEVIKQRLSPYTPPETNIEIYKPGGYAYKPKLLYTEEPYGLFARYQTATENRIYRALTILRKLQGYE